jgi:hypothetical protein
MDASVHSPSRRLGAAAFSAGLLSGALLVAAVLWAHHWSPATQLLVTAWALAMLATPPLAVVAHRVESAPRLANWGIVLNVLAWLALGFLGLLILNGSDVAACGGG